MPERRKNWTFAAVAAVGAAYVLRRMAPAVIVTPKQFTVAVPTGLEGYLGPRLGVVPDGSGFIYPGGGNTSSGLVDENPEGDSPLLEDQDAREQGPPYAGPTGGAVGGTPAQRRASGGRTHHGIAPHGDHRGDSTVGADPDADAE